MQGFRKYVLAVSLGIAILFAAAAVSTPATTHRHRSLDDSILTRILEFFGIELFGTESQGRISIPPG